METLFPCRGETDVGERGMVNKFIKRERKKTVNDRMTMFSFWEKRKQKKNKQHPNNAGLPASITSFMMMGTIWWRDDDESTMMIVMNEV